MAPLYIYMAPLRRITGGQHILSFDSPRKYVPRGWFLGLAGRIGDPRELDRASRERDGSGPRGTGQDPWDRAGSRGANQGPAGRIRAPRDGPGPARRIGAHGSDQNPAGRTKPPLDEPGASWINRDPTGRIRASQDESGLAV